MAKFRLQEAWKLPNGEFHTPHWDEWLDRKYHNAIPEEEVEAGIEHLGEWYEVDDKTQGPSVGDLVWWNDPDNGECSGLYEIANLDLWKHDGDTVSLKTLGDMTVNEHCLPITNECYLSECTILPLYRRIAETTQRVPKVVAKLPNYDVEWTAYKTKHVVRYGKQVKEFRGKDKDLAAAHEFGICVRHAAECEGIIESEG